LRVFETGVGEAGVNKMIIFESDADASRDEDPSTAEGYIAVNN
jgi:hypothetical protein